MAESNICCPECNSNRVKVVTTTRAETGEIVRRRACAACKHRWYTKQTPEELLDQNDFVWFRRNGICKSIKLLNCQELSNQQTTLEIND